MKFKFPVRTTRKKKCREGFYILINGVRIHCRNKRSAVKGVADWLSIQRVQIVTVREYTDRNRKRIIQRMPKPYPVKTMSESGTVVYHLPPTKKGKP